MQYKASRFFTLLFLLFNQFFFYFLPYLSAQVNLQFSVAEYQEVTLPGKPGKSFHYAYKLNALNPVSKDCSRLLSAGRVCKVAIKVNIPQGYSKIGLRVKEPQSAPITLTIFEADPARNGEASVQSNALTPENNYSCVFRGSGVSAAQRWLFFENIDTSSVLYFFSECDLDENSSNSGDLVAKKAGLSAFSGNNYTCENAICVSANKEYTNRNRPGCGQCLDVWRTPPPGNACDWILMDNPVFFQFELLQDRAVSITLNNIICSGGGGKLQLGIWRSSACQPGNLGATGFIACASDSNSITINQNLTAGSYLLVADGDSRSECTWRFTSTIPFLTAGSNSVFADSLKNQICEGENLNLRVQGAPPGAAYLWQGPGGFTSTAPDPIRVNPLATHSGLYTVIVTPGPGSVCKNIDTITTQVNIKPRPMLMAPDSVLRRCVGQSATLTAITTPEASGFTWRGPNNFSANQLNVSLTNLTVAQSGTYFITVRNDSTRCASSKSVSLEVFNTPSLPFVAPGVITRCGSGFVDIEAAMGNLAGNTLLLYNQAQGGEILAQDSTAPFILRTPILEPGNYTFYIASAFQSTGCQSRRTPAQITVHPNISRPLIDNPSLKRCGTGPVAFTAQLAGASQANEIRLYTEPSGTSAPIAQDNVSPFELITPSLNPGNYTFYLRSVNTLTGCVSEAVDVQAFVSSSVSPPLAPNPPNPRCGAGSITISAFMGAAPGNQMNLYTTPLGGAPIATASSAPYEITIPSLTSSTSFYLSALDTRTGCESSRLEVPATVFVLPLTPRPNNTLVASCMGGAVTFTDPRNLNDTEMRLYTVPVGGVSIATDNFRPYNLTVTNISADATYYIESSAISSGCVNPSRVQVRAVAVENPGAPIVQGDTLCGSGQGNIIITPTLPAPTGIVIYSQPTGGVELATLTTPPFSFITPVINQTTTYYIEAANQVAFLGVDCRSERIPVVVIVHPLPQEPNIGNFSRCEAGSVRIVASFADTEADQLRIFETPQGGEPILSTSTLPLVFSLNVSSTTTFFALAENSVTGCKSQRIPFTVTINPNPGIPNAATISSCGAGLTAFTAFMGNPPGNRALLYETNVGGAPIASSSVSPYELPVFVATTAQYFLEAISAAGCTSARREVLAALRERPGLPFAEGVSRCGAGEVLFTVTMGFPAGNEVRLYTQALGGSAISLDNAFPFTLRSVGVTTTTTFFVESLQGNGCRSLRSPVIATILPVPGAPSAPVTPSRCGPGRIIFTAQMGNPPGNAIRLYTLAFSGDSLLDQDDIPLYEFITPVLTTNSILFLESYNSATGCVSSKVATSFTIHSFPAPPSAADIAICRPSAVTLTVSMSAGSEARLFSLPSGGAPLDITNTFPYRLTTPVVSLTSTFYLESYDANTACQSTSRSLVSVRVENRPRMPNAQLAVRCGPGTVIFNDTLQATTGISLRLYSQPQGGSALAQDPTFPYAVTTPIVTTTTTFYLGFFNAINNCEGDRQEAVALVHPRPGLPLSDSIEACGTGRVLILASQGTPPGNQMAIYDNPISNNPIATVFIPPFNFQLQNIGSSKTFYLESKDSNTGCTSERKTIAIKLLPAPGAPTAPDILLCSPATATITALMGAPAGDEILLYTSPFAATPIARDSTFPDFTLRTPLVSVNSTFYVASLNKVSRCESERYPVRVTVAAPAQPTVSNQERCGGGRLTFFVSGGFFDEVRLYDVAFGSSPIATDNSSLARLETPIVTATTTFYVSAIVGGCETVRTPALAFVQPLPPLPIVAPTSRCGSGPVTFTAQLSGSAAQVRVYELPAGGLPLAQAAGFPYILNLPAINTTTTFYFETVDSDQKCISGSRAAATAVLHPIPGTPLVNTANRCGTGVLTFSVTMQAPFGNEIRLYTLPFGAAPIGSSGSFPYQVQTPSITTTASFYIESYNTQTGCNSAPAIALAVIQPLPAKPIVADTQRCAAGQGLFRAQMQNPAGNRMRLYATETGGLPFTISNGPDSYFLSTPPVTTHTLFYIEATDTLTGCTGARSAARLLINALPGTPAVVEGYVCGRQTASFSVIMGSPPGTEVRLYGTSTGGAPLSSDNSEPYILTTPPISTVTTFFIESYHSGVGCASALRQPVIASGAPGNPIVSPASRCGAGKVTFLPTFSSPAGDVFRLYTSSSGGNPIATDGVSPYELSTPEIRETTLFYIEALSRATGCVSERAPIEAVILPLPGAPLASDVERCAEGGVYFTVAPGPGGGNEFRLYASQTAVTPLATDVLFPYELETPIVSTHTVFYIEPRDGNTGCAGERTPVRALVNSLPPAPLVEKPFICSGALTQLPVLLDTRFANEALIFDSPSATLPLLPPDNTPPYEFSIPASPANTTFYLAARNAATGCISRTTPVEVVALPGTPSAENISRCGSGSVIFTGRFGSPPGDILRLYSQPAAGVALQATDASPYTIETPSVANSTVFYLESVQRSSGCVSPRTPLLLTISPLPDPAQVEQILRCDEGPVTFSVKPPLALGVSAITTLYSLPFGGAPIATDFTAPYELTTPTLSSNATFYVEVTDGRTGCKSPMALAQAEVFSSPAPPTANNLFLCEPAIAQISALIPLDSPGNQVALFDSPAGGLLIASAFARPYLLSTPLIATNTTYWLESTNTLSGCTSKTRSEVRVTMAPKPGTPFAENQSRCGSSIFTFTAFMRAPLGNALRFYDSPSSNFPIASASGEPYLFLTPLVSTTTTFYIENINTTTGCRSARFPVVAEILPLPGLPEASDLVRCTKGRTFILANMGNPAGDELRLYNSGGALLSSDASAPYELETPNLTTTTIFWVESRNNRTGCLSARKSVTVQINSAPPAPTIASNSPICEKETLRLTATGVSGGVYIWLGPGGFSATGNAITIANTNTANAGVYSAIAILGGCTSDISTTVVAIRPQPIIPIINANATLCLGDTLRLQAPVVPGATYAWLGPDNLNASGAEVTLPNIQLRNAGVYSVRQTLNQCVSEPYTLNITVSSPRAGFTTPSQAVCSETPVNFNIVASGNFPMRFYYLINNEPQNREIETANSTFSQSFTSSVTLISQYVVDALGCVTELAPAPIAINIYNRPQARFISAPSICAGAAAQLNVAVESAGANNWLLSYLEGATPKTTTGAGNGIFRIVTSPLMNDTPIQLLSIRNTDDNCVRALQDTTARVLVRASPLPSLQVFSSPSCENDTAKIELSLTGKAPWFLQWEENGQVRSLNIASTSTPSPYLFVLNRVLAQTTVFRFQLLTDNNACTQRALPTFTQVVTPRPTAMFDAPAKAVCVGANVQYTLTLSGKAPWLVDYTVNNAARPSLELGNANTVGPQSFTFTLPLLADSLLQLTQVRDAFLCRAQNLPSVYLRAKPIPSPVQNAGSNAPLCEGGTLRLTATGAVSPAAYLWQGPNGFFSASSEPTIDNVGLQAKGAYTVSTLQEGCASAPFTLDVEILPAPAPPVFNLPALLCQTQPLILRASPNPDVNFNWAGSNGFAAIGPEHTLRLEPGAYAFSAQAVSISNGCASPKVTREVVIEPLPSVDLPSVGFFLCAGQNAALPIVFKGTPPFSFTYQIGAGVPITVNNIQESPYLLPYGVQNPETVTLRVEEALDQSVCRRSLAPVITTIQSITPPALQLVEIEHARCGLPGGRVRLRASGGSGVNSWVYYRSGSPIENASGIFEQLPPGVYTFGVRDGLCQSTLRVEILETSLPSPFITAITYEPATASHTLTVAWSAVPGAVSYNLRFRAAGSSVWFTLPALISTEREITGLAPGTTYEFSVQAVCLGGSASAFSESRSGATAGAPTNCNASILQARDLQDGNVGVQWTSVNEAFCYEIQYGPLTAPEIWVSLFRNSPLTSLTLNLPAGTYGFRVRTHCGGCPGFTSGWSAVQSLTIRGAAKGIASFAGDLESFVYPNPTYGAFTLSGHWKKTESFLSGEPRAEVFIYNNKGEMVGSASQSNFTLEGGGDEIVYFEIPIDLSSYPAGVYWVKLHIANDRQVFRVLKW